MGKEEGEIDYVPLFETKRDKVIRIIVYRLFSLSLLLAIFSIWFYRFSHLPTSHAEEEDGKCWAVWFGLVCGELWFGVYWVITQALRWKPVYRQTFKHSLSQRYENRLPKVDIFVCTADPEVEPAMMVINTVLSVMAYDYPSQKLSVYVSDDAASPITFYALLEASFFAKHWLPYCKTFKVDPTSPSAYFSAIHTANPTTPCDDHAHHLEAIKKLYEEMERRINEAAKSGEVPKEERSKHKAFSEWDNSYSSRQDHDTILQILLHRKDPHNSKDVNGFALPTLVYLAREKRPQHHHLFKAGAMNSLLRVSSKISNGKIILNVDCDMYSNNSQSVRDALCFFMDEQKGHEIAFVQFPQNFVGLTQNDLYGSSLRVMSDVEFHGADGYGGPLYIGTGCFHRRDVLCGKKFSDEQKNIIEWNSEDDDELAMEATLVELEQESKALASCTYEQNTLWGTEMGLVYGCAVEDVITGLCIQSKGWKSVYYNPERKGFLGVAPTTLPQTLVQHKRWSEGDFQILLSKYSPAWYAYGRISLGLQMGYCTYCLWAPSSLPTLFYCIVPSLCLLKGIPLFPKISSPWFIPFAYVIIGETCYSILEFLTSGGTMKGWWNDLRIWLYKRTISYLFAFIDTLLKLLGFPSDSGFTITAKVADDDVSQRYKKEIMEFGTSSPMFTLLATLAMLNLLCFLGMLKDGIMSEGNGVIRVCEKMGLQVVLCGFLVVINLPIYQGLFFRKDNGRLPSIVAIRSTALALGACVLLKALH